MRSSLWYRKEHRGRGAQNPASSTDVLGTLNCPQELGPDGLQSPFLSKGRRVEGGHGGDLDSFLMFSFLFQICGVIIIPAVIYPSLSVHHALDMRHCVAFSPQPSNPYHSDRKPSGNLVQGSIANGCE